jgi:myb proto-oncogene protein
MNEIDPTLNRSPFSEAERLRLIELQARYGNKWTQIASEMPGRSEKMVKNYWNNAKLRQQRKQSTAHV